MRGLIARILASVARILAQTVTLTVQLVDGMWTTVRRVVFGQGAPALAGAAAAVIDETVPDVELPAATPAARREMVLSEPERIRRAAAALRDGKRVPTAYLDPQKSGDAELLKWMGPLDQLHLAHLVRATDMDLDLHLAGTKRLPLPLLPRDEEVAERVREAKRPLSYSEWVRILQIRAAEDGDDDPNVDAILDRAEELVSRNACLGDERDAGHSSPAPRDSGVSDDLTEDDS